MARTNNWLHDGYLAGLTGDEPDETRAYVDSEYEAGYLAGLEDREGGVIAPKYLGWVENLTVPFKKGDMVTIPKGTTIRSTSSRGTFVAGRTYKVKVHSVDNGSVAYLEYGQNTVRRPTPPEVRWVGTGGYWCQASLIDIPEAR